MHDLVLKGGRAIDPSSGLESVDKIIPPRADPARARIRGQIGELSDTEYCERALTLASSLSDEAKLEDQAIRLGLLLDEPRADVPGVPDARVKQAPHPAPCPLPLDGGEGESRHG